jgi:hypothetical protein
MDGVVLISLLYMCQGLGTHLEHYLTKAPYMRD